MIRRSVVWLFGAVAAILVLNGVWGVARFQANGLFGDQWSFYQPLFEGASWWEVFNWQHGPHRQGLAFLLTAGVLELSQWDARIESLWIFLQLIAATGLALNLKRRLLERIQISDIWIVIAGLSLVSYETILLVPNASHSIFPLLGLMVLANIWPTQWTTRRAGWVGLIVVMLSFTGFGLFSAALAVLVLLFGMARDLRNGFDSSLKARLWAVGIALAGGLLFARGYVFSPASEDFSWWGQTMSDYGRFILLMLAGRGGWDGESIAAYGFGLVTCGVGLFALTGAIKQLLAKENPRGGEVAVVLIGTTLAFAVFTALGRAHLQIDGGMASRYMALLLPMWWGADLIVSRSARKWTRYSVSGLGMIMAFGPWAYLVDRPVGDWAGTIGMRDGDLHNLRSFQSGKIAWISTHRDTGDWRIAEEWRPGGVYPFVETHPMDARIQAMKERGLSFTAGDSISLAWLPWMADRMVRRMPQRDGRHGAWILRPRAEGFINLQGNAPVASTPIWAIRLSEQYGKVDSASVAEGISIAVEPGDFWLRLDHPIGARLGSPSITVLPKHPTWVWRDGSLRRDRALRIVAGFYGWEDGTAFGWTAAQLEAEVVANSESYLNVRLDSRFDAVDSGAILLRIGAREWEYSTDDLQSGVSVRLLESDAAIPLILRNMAGARSPAGLGLWSDERQLALRLTEFSVSAKPSYAVSP